MTAASFFTCPQTCHRLYLGPVGPYIDRFAQQLQEQGYTRNTVRTQLCTVAHFSHWLSQHKRGLESVQADQIQRYFTARQRKGRRVCSAQSAALHALAAWVQQQCPIADAETVEPPSERERVEQDFQRYLAQTRGLSAATQRHYQPVIARFLRERFADEPVRWDTLQPAAITAFVQRHIHGHSHSHAQQAVKALRAFLRYLQHRGTLADDLTACVPTVADWSSARLPACLSAYQLQQVLAQCPRDTALGRRNYAMLLLLARLGLRASEVAALTLEDIDWQAGCLAIRNKGGRWSQLPLPQDVGAAISNYLRQGRPVCSDRRVFIREHAPRIGFTDSTGVSAVAAQALTRAGIQLPRQGAHLFRHTLATQLLQQGASLPEIAQVLRHQQLDTTRIYAKVELTALRELAPPWPGGEV